MASRKEKTAAAVVGGIGLIAITVLAVNSLKDRFSSLDLKAELTKVVSAITQTAAAMTPTPLFLTEIPTPTATATATPSSTETPTPEPDLFVAFSASDRKILAEVGNLDQQQKWQDVLTSVDTNYAGWTGIAMIGADGKYYGLYGDQTFHEMPANYTPENNPITQAAWPDRVFPLGYFNGIQPLNAPDMVDNRPTVMTRIYQEDRNIIPIDVVAAKGSQVLFGQGIRLELDNGKQSFDQSPAFVISFDANLHGHVTKGELDDLWLPKNLSPEAQRLVGFTWFGGYRASTAEWQPKVHGTDYNHADTFEITGNANTDLVSTPLWLNDDIVGAELQSIGDEISIYRPDVADEQNKYTVTNNLNPLDYPDGDPFKAVVATAIATTKPVFRRKRNAK